MAHIALYRKYRSQTFEDLVGQEHVVKTLQNAVNRDSIHHAFLFTGPRGTGKTSSARLLAKALNCEKGPTGSPCGTCHICEAIAGGSCMDVIEMDAASEAGVDEVRERIVEVVDYRPTMCRYKVYIVDEVHDLSPKAFDALLKTIEEPPGHVVFVLATTELHKVPPTIQSRCQKFTFNRATMADLTGRLEYVLKAEGKEFEKGAVLAIARMADGGYRDALSLLEQAIVTTDGALTLEHVVEQLGLIREEQVDGLIMATHTGDGAKILASVDEIYASGRDARSILEAMLTRLAYLTRAAYGVEIGAAADAAQEAALRATASQLGPQGLLSLREAIAGSLKDVRDVSLPKLFLESMLLNVRNRLDAISDAPPPVQQPVRQVKAATPEATPVVKEAPITPTPQAEPKVEAVAAVQLPESLSDDPKIRSATRIWKEVVAHFAATSKAAAAKLGTTKVTEVSDGKVIICFSSQMFKDSITGNLKALALIREQWANRGGTELGDLTFSVASNGGGGKGGGEYGGATVMGGPDGPVGMAPAVELPLEGQRLQDAVEQKFEGL